MKLFSSSDETTFNVVSGGKQYKYLPPGIYSTVETQFGILFTKEIFNTDELIQIEDDLYDKCINDIENFWTKKSVFKEHNFPFKRGILLYGPPGSGKTCALKFISNNIISKSGIVLHFSYPRVFNEALRRLREIQPETPVVVLMEDIDDLLAQDEAEITEILDGFNYCENIVFLATTNDINDIDDKIKNRPSRFDKRIMVDPPSTKVRKFYLENIAKLSSIPISITDKWIEDTEKMSFAQLKELYIGVHILGSEYQETLERVRDMTVDIENYKYKVKNPIDNVKNSIDNITALPYPFNIPR